jgi:guanylate kinase
MSAGKALIFSAPSGSGKTTIVKHLLNNHNNLAFSISACTRPRRENEVAGQDYYFLSVDEFKNGIDKAYFVEWEEVYEGNYYGTLKSEVERIWQQGKTVVFDVDVKGGVKLKEYFKDQALAVFIKVPSLDVLEARLKGRGTETAETLKARITKAEYELSFEKEFDIIIINDKLEDSFEEAMVAVNNFLNQ